MYVGTVSDNLYLYEVLGCSFEVGGYYCNLEDYGVDFYLRNSAF